MHGCDVPLMLIFYVLLRPVNGNLALLAVLFNLTQTAVLVANKLNLLLPIFLLGDAEYLKAFTPEQLQALSYVSLRTHDNGFAVGLVFFGAACLLVGYLIIRSGYLPRTFGVEDISARNIVIVVLFFAGHFLAGHWRLSKLSWTYIAQDRLAT